MKRAIILGGVTLILIAGVTALLLAKRYHLTALTSVELTIKQPELRRVLERAAAAEECSMFQHTLELAYMATNYRDKKPIKVTTPLNVDEIAIYRAVLQQWLSGERTSLNVSITTFPFDSTFPSLNFTECVCLEGIDAETILSASHSFHDLTPDVLFEKNMRLVDANKQAIIVHANDPDKTMGKRKSVNDAVENAFAHGLFSMSEIVFDKEHHHALVTYSFWCGSLCGSGATLLFEKVGGEWKKNDRTCGGWIS